MTKKKFLGFLAVIILIVVLGAAYLIGYKFTGTWDVRAWVNGNIAQGDQSDNEEPTTQLLAVSSVGTAMHDEMDYAMPAAMAFVTSVAETRAASGVTLTANLSNNYIRGDYEWIFDFENPASEWATGKVASDYLRLTPDTETPENANVMAIKAFSEPIIITATLVGGKGSSGTCKIDYLHKFSGGNIECSGSCEFGEMLTLGLGNVFGDGTLYGDLVLSDCVLSYDTTFKEIFDSHLKISVPLTSTVLSEKLNCEIVGNGFAASVPITINYSTFIKNFDSYSDEQKQAIYYAWWVSSKEVDSNVGFVGTAVYSYNGVKIGDFNPYVFFNISGAALGSQVSPDVNFNDNIVL